MPQIGPLEILFVGVLALMIFGPEKLPEMGRTIGKHLGQLKGIAAGVKSEFESSMAEEKSPAAPATSGQDADSAKNETSSSPDVSNPKTDASPSTGSATVPEVTPAARTSVKVGAQS